MKKIAIIAVMTISGTADAITVHRVTSLADHGQRNTTRGRGQQQQHGDRVTFAPWLFQKIIRLNSANHTSTKNCASRAI